MTTKYLSVVAGTICMALLVIPGNPSVNHQYPKGFTVDRILQKDDSAYSIYLTIDDGPSETSMYIDSVASAERAKINVFLVGSNISGRLLYKNNSFIEIGNHSYLHADGHYRAYYRNAGKVLHDFEHNAVVLSVANKIARLPGRNTWRMQGRKQTDLVDANNAGDSLAAAGFRLFGWDLEWRCYPGTDTVQSAALIMHRIEKVTAAKNSFTPGHLVILCHEKMFACAHNKQELARLIRMINDKKGYRLQWLSKYPS
ncbi:MAG: polysaccharide deacetylase family protein [Bacteroidota bacterium]